MRHGNDTQAKRISLRNATRTASGLLVGCLIVFSQVILVPGTALAKTLVIGTGQSYTVTDSHVVLEGIFSGVIIAADHTFVDLKKAIIDCGGVSESVGVNIGAQTKVRILKGTVRNCTIGVLIGNRFSGGPGGSKNHISGMLVEMSAPSGTAFEGAGIVIDSGTNNHLHDNYVNNVGGPIGSQAIWVFRGEDNKITNNHIGQIQPSFYPPSGIALQQASSVIVDGNTIATVVGAAIRLVQGSDYNTITNNVSVNNADPEMVDDSPSCAHNIWSNNVFVTDGGAETDGPNSGCIQ